MEPNAATYMRKNHRQDHTYMAGGRATVDDVVEDRTEPCKDTQPRGHSPGQSSSLLSFSLVLDCHRAAAVEEYTQTARNLSSPG
ncbi:hypothetical protein DPEC_G00009870 [Dallia pectoralis]|uniref:Uncharacterized protein n=1 Tax=Dallia pectoralis TaxID=75939 RepID=A0ACC2HM27_DALPE|nr:hypothetical protein DPEC_G00009870 [Dallia pectoralis]